MQGANQASLLKKPFILFSHFHSEIYFQKSPLPPVMISVCFLEAEGMTIHRNDFLLSSVFQVVINTDVFLLSIKHTGLLMS